VTTKSSRSRHLYKKKTDIKRLLGFGKRLRSFYNKLIRKNNPLAAFITLFKILANIVELISIYTLKLIFFKYVTDFLL
jgi:hypothetical protein